MIPVTEPSRSQPPGAFRIGTLGLLPALLLTLLFTGKGTAAEPISGRDIMDEVFRRHEQFPYTYEEQTMVLMDAAGHRDARKLRRFSRIESDGTLKYLLVFDHPEEVRGVALLALRDPAGRVESGIYLPAFGRLLKSGSGDVRGSQFLGTDFSLEDLTAELLSDFRYRRGEDRQIEEIPHFVVDANPGDPELERISGYGRKRHFIRRDNFFLTRTDYYDRKGRLFKRQTQHDLRPVNGDMWRADMILMEDRRERHKTLIKIDKRVFSADYVPAELFDPERLLTHLHVMPPGHLLSDPGDEPDIPQLPAPSPEGAEP
jgi:hypothetical protein